MIPDLILDFGDDDPLVLTVTRVDRVRLERIDRRSIVERFVGDVTDESLYRLAWLAAQRAGDPRVAPILDLSQVNAGTVNAAVDRLAELAELHIDA